MSTLNTPKRVMKPVSTANQCSPAISSLKSFTPNKRKTSLTMTFVYRPLVICPEKKP